MKFSIFCELIYILSVIALSVSQYYELEDDYVKAYGNDPKNPKGAWPQAKMMQANDTLKDICGKLHLLNGRIAFEPIDEAHVQDGTLHFTRTDQTFNPMAIDVVNYTTHKDNKQYYITKGPKEDCILYLRQIDGMKSDFHMVQLMYDPKNPKGTWPEAKTMEANDTLADFCSKVHFLNGRTSYEAIYEANVFDGILRFTKVNGTYNPMAITVVNFISNKDHEEFYLTKGLKDDCLIYLRPTNGNKSEFRIAQHLCDCVFF